MGSWGTGILQDDTAQDVYQDYLERVDAGKTHSGILASLRKSWAGAISDSDDGPSFWQAVACAQWECGALSRKVLAKNVKLVKAGAGLERWIESGLATKRRKVLRAFLRKLRKPNPRPRKVRAPKGPSRNYLEGRSKSATEIEYPFTPKSNALLRPGQFWAVPLSDGRFACGRVLELPPADYEYGRDVTFFAAIMDWASKKPPSAESIAGTRILEQGKAHIKTILATGGQILGYRRLGADRLKPRRELSAVFPPCDVVQGYKTLRPATKRDVGILESASGWGFKFISAVGEHAFVEKKRRKS